jgi:hypothetical protein
LIDGGAVEHAKLQLTREAGHRCASKTHSAETLTAHIQSTAVTLHHLYASQCRPSPLCRVDGKIESGLQQTLSMQNRAMRQSAAPACGWRSQSSISWNERHPGHNRRSRELDLRRRKTGEVGLALH